MSDDENQLIAQRRAKLTEQRSQGNAFPNTFRPTHKASELHAAHDNKEKGDLAAEDVRVKVAGRMMFQRVMGKASFCRSAGCHRLYPVVLSSGNIG